MSAVKEWPTPNASGGGYNQGGAQGKVGPIRYTLDGLAAKEGRQLNPDWVETLMGFPVGWTAGPPDEVKPSTIGSRRVRFRKRAASSAATGSKPSVTPSSPSAANSRGGA